MTKMYYAKLLQPIPMLAAGANVEVPGYGTMGPSLDDIAKALELKYGVSHIRGYINRNAFEVRPL
jgi:hypothetical protein